MNDHTTVTALGASPAFDPPEHTPEELLRLHSEPKRALALAEARPDASPALNALEKLRGVNVAAMSDDNVALFREMVRDAKSAVASGFDAIVARCDDELIARMRAAGGRAIPSFEFETIALEDVYTQYAFDLEKLRAAKALLPTEDAAKLTKTIPETVMPAREVAGPPVSIAAIARKYGSGSEVGKLLAEAMTRTKVGENLVIKRAAAVGGVR